MKILSLKLLHYRRFRQEEINFRDDFSLIFWKNGSGKSSLLDAIWYALFGPGSKDFVRVSREHLRSDFLREREPSKIALQFQYGMHNYQIVRIIDAGTKKFASEFIPENKDTLTGPEGLEIIGGDEINHYVEELIGMNKEIFLRSVFAKQKDIEVLSWGLAQRKELINKILWLDLIEEIIEQLKKDEKEKKTLLEIYKKKVGDFDEKLLKEKQQQLQEQIAKIKEEYEKAEQKKQLFFSEYEKIKITFEEISKKKTLFTQYQWEIAIKKEQLTNIDKNIFSWQQELLQIEKYEIYLEENKHILWEKQKYDALILEQENLKNQYQIKCTLEQDIKKYQNESEKLQAQMHQYSWENIKEKLQISEKEIEKYTQMMNEYISLRSKLEQELLQLTNDGKTLTKELEILQDLWPASSCPTCKRPLQEDFPYLMSLFEKDLKEKRALYKEKQTLLTQVLWDITQWEKYLWELKEQSKKLQSLEKEILVIQNQLQNLSKISHENSHKLLSYEGIVYDEENHQKIKKEFDRVHLLFQEYTKISGQVVKKQDILNYLQKASAEKERFQKEWQEKEILLSQLDFQEAQYEMIQKQFQEQHQKMYDINKEIHDIEKVKLTLEFDMKTLLVQEKDFVEDKKQIDIFVREVSESILKKQILSDYILYLLAYMKPRIEDMASEYFSLITDGKYTSLSLDEDYNIMIDEKNIDLYSGGERDLANLCFRLSLGQNLTTHKGNPIHFLVLDEILASQDRERQQNILLHLKKLENKFSQIILISHAEEMKELATNLMEVTSLSRQESTIVYH